MAFPDDYHENTGRCMGKYQDHSWSHTGHPLKHRCNNCHQPRWIEDKKVEEISTTYIPSIVWGGNL